MRNSSTLKASSLLSIKKPLKKYFILFLLVIMFFVGKYDATAADFQNPAKSETLSGGPEKPFTAEELAQIAEVKDSLTTLRSAVAQATGDERAIAQQALDAYRASADCQAVIAWNTTAKTDYIELSKTKQYKAHDDRDYTRETGEATTARDRDMDTKNYFIARDKIRQTNFVERQIGLSGFDAKFAEILANPQYEGTVRAKEKPELSKALAKEIFAAFSPEVQKVFLDMNLKLNVKKYDDQLRVECIYGTNENNEEVKLMLLTNRKQNTILYVIEDKEYGKVLAQTDQGQDGKMYTQQLREKDGVIEKIIIDEDGSVRTRTRKATKFPDQNQSFTMVHR